MSEKRLCSFALLVFVLVCSNHVTGEPAPWPPPDWTTVDCSDLHKYNSSRWCTFVKTADNCQLSGGYIPYYKIVYCHIASNLIPLSVTVMFLWLIFLVIALGSTAEDYFCPSLTVISSTLRLNQNGVTFLAFGNGAPDIFSAITAISTSKQGDITLAIGALFGAGIFVSAIVVGAICITTNFTLTSRPFLRDVIFYIAAVAWTFAILWKGKVYLGEAIGFIALYGLYVVVVVFGHFIYQKTKKRRDVEEEQQLPDENTPLLDESAELEDEQKPSDTEMMSVAAHRDTTEGGVVGSGSHSEELLPSHRRRSFNVPRSSPADMDAEMLRNLQHQRRHLRIKRLSYGIASALDIGETVGVSVLGRGDIAHPRPMLRRPTMQDRDNGEEDAEETEPLISETSSGEEQKRDHPLIYAFKGLKPLNYDDWKEENIVWKILDIIKIPIMILLRLSTPVVDNEQDYNGWNKWLNVWHCIVGPVFITFAGGGYGVKLNGMFPVWAVLLIVGVVLAVVVGLTSRPYEPPVYHPLFAYLGFAVSMLWIYVVANEIVNGLQTIGAVFSIGYGILGLTFLAWANSVGDFISDLTMAKQGFPRMGIAACFGGPLLNLLLGFGIGTTIECLKSKDHVMELKVLSSVEFICTMFLFASLAFSLVVVTLILRFRVGRIYGITLVCLYVAFLIIAIIGEQKLILSPL